jgi:rhamnogalacturonyl hydrolase YesR
VHADDFAGGCVAVHHGHVQVHQDQLVARAALAGLLDVVTRELNYRFLAVQSFVGQDAEGFTKDQLQREQVEEVVVYYQNCALAAAILFIRNYLVFGVRSHLMLLIASLA